MGSAESVFKSLSSVPNPFKGVDLSNLASRATSGAKEFASGMASALTSKESKNVAGAVGKTALAVAIQPPYNSRSSSYGRRRPYGSGSYGRRKSSSLIQPIVNLGGSKKKEISDKFNTIHDEITSKKEKKPSKKETNPPKKEKKPSKKETTPSKKETTPSKKEKKPSKKETTSPKKEKKSSKK